MALNTGMECVVMGDFNLDFLSFYRSDLPVNSQAYRLQPLVDELLSRVGPYGVKQCVVGPTRQGRTGQSDSGLDHLWTNNPAKMSQIYSHYNGSDHKVIMGVRYFDKSPYKVGAVPVRLQPTHQLDCNQPIS